MPTLTLPRTFRVRAGATVVLTALAAAGASWVAAPTASAAGENGDIRIHHVGVPFGVSKDDPRVCKFYLDAVNFDVLTTIAYTITPQPPLPTAATVAGTIQLAGGAGHTDPLGVADGQYKITWIVAGAPKEKVFRVNCHDGKRDAERRPGDQIEDQREGGGWSKDSNGPKGGVHAGGGGLVDTAAAFAPVTAAGAVGLVAVGGVAYFRMNRRRPNGAA
ncbi:hypothetical protein OIE43_33525 [Streptomyces pseudovenezuelae]|uniref:Gram-positive cocci surface proteins LPxTG domain-containing protein n=1 Tax=Streptomyces pseudovenezuelae TaxID=67350 RepID=A0A117PNW5_9ACTN|nr:MULTISPECIES: hypothetical protein [Streptomyces]KUM83570.1 hypothetical protein AQI94_34880 [Streptomyces pseudovenezuelae]WUA92037.1 hypothetical protein OHO81_34080 [Streptomyces pseudovenezuelae]